MALLELFKEQLENESRAIGETEGLEKRGDLLIWWYFQKLVGLRSDEIQEIHTDGSNDFQIDAVHIDVDNIVHFYSFKNPEKIDKAFPSNDVSSMLIGLGLLIQGKLTEANATAGLLARAAEVKQAVRKGYRIHLVTSGRNTAKDVATKVQTFISNLRAPSEDFCRLEFEDIKGLQDRFYAKSLPTIEEAWTFGLEQAPYQVRAGNHESYMFVAGGSLLAEIYGKHGEPLLQQNIRVSTGDTATNALIRATATGTDSGNFLHYNNGIVFLAGSASWDQFARQLTLRRFQVVNGGQTIRILGKTFAAMQLRTDVQVPVRVITTAQDKDFANNVTVNLNNQNRIEPSFLRSNDSQVIQLASALASRGWYLERRESELDTLTEADRATLEATFGVPLEEHAISMKSGIQAYVATYMGDVELAKRYTKQIFIGEADGGQFENVFSKDLTADKVILAHRIWAAVGGYVNQFKRIKARRDRGTADWQAYYEGILGKDLCRRGPEIDAVIPPSIFFLSAVVFEDWVRLRGKPSADLLATLESGDFDILNQEIALIIDARANMGGESRSWPTLLKSKILFDKVRGFLVKRLA